MPVLKVRNEDNDGWYEFGTQGPQGYQGTQGHQGVVGAQGDQGVTGSQGAQGAVGSTGPQGSIGAQGSVGAQGYQGIEGDQGYQGQIGNQGFQGNQGSTGGTGDTGPEGTQGPQGAIGAQGPPGAQGQQGVVGSQGSVGAQGNQGAVGDEGSQGAIGAQGSQGTIGAQGSTGPQGAAGAQGATGPAGSQGPQGEQGLLGDTLAHHVQITEGGWLQTGSGTKDSTLTGINLDQNELVGQASGVDQFRIGVDGKAYVGATVKLNSDGITLGSVDQINNRIKWKDEATVVSYFINCVSSSTNWGEWRVRNKSNSLQNNLEMIVKGPSVNEDTYIRLRNKDLAGHAGDVRFYINNNPVLTIKDEVVLIDGSIEGSIPIGIRAIRATTQVATTGIHTALCWNTSIHNTAISFAPPSTKLYAMHTGYYMAGGGISFDTTNATGSHHRMALTVKQDGHKTLHTTEKTCIDGQWRGSLAITTGMFHMSIEDYIEVMVYHNDAANLTVAAASTSNQNKNLAWLVRMA